MKIDNRFAFFCLLVTATLITSTQAGADVVSPWYLSNGTHIAVVQGTSVINSWETNQPGNDIDYAMAVNSTVRTIAEGLLGGDSGSEYTLSGTYTGTDYQNPDGGGWWYDGTTDGTYNYAVRQGSVNRYNSDWSNEVGMFTVNVNSSSITFDPTNNTLWVVQNDFGSALEHYSMTGTLLGQFSTPGSYWALSLDHADGTLWMTDGGTNLFQYSKAGVLLDSFAVAGLGDLGSGGNWLGGEFSFAGQVTVPEPASGAILGMVFLLACNRRRRS